MVVDCGGVDLQEEVRWWTGCDDGSGGVDLQEGCDGGGGATMVGLRRWRC